MTAPGPNGAAEAILPRQPEPDSIRIRLAHTDDLDSLPEIERSAGEAFRDSSQAAVANDAPTPADSYLPMLAEGLVWVAEDKGQLIGFAAGQIYLDALHIWEIAVRHDRQGRGAGRALMARAIDEARAQDLPAVTLSTFRDIAFNGPFYASLGFRELMPEELNGRLTAVLMRERRLGLDADARCAMRLTL